MEPESVQIIRIHLPEIPMALFSTLWGSGLGIRTRLGTSLEAFLCDQLGMDPDYLEHRLQTIIVNGQAVDRVDQLLIADGDVIALSAAMPGLAGAALRKGGHLSVMRSEISQKSGRNMVPQDQTGMITLKLFNMVVREIGPQILSTGIWLSGQDAAELVEKLSVEPKPVITAGSTDWVEFNISSPA